ncbi:MAG: alpha-amylase family glycosyl hydrolase, partial [Firmicutes bacterium]|nr:alpha-amylase family glycosyl hydrolase [Bacillota bacterium]
VWEDASNKQSYGEKRRYLFGEELDGVMNYPFRDAAQAFILGKLDAEDMAARFISQLENYPAYALVNNLNLIGTQLDRNTPAGRLAAEEYELTPEQRQLGKQRLKLLSLLQFTMLGVPCVYYGDEAGCEGLPDPFNRGTYPWGREDEDLFYWYRRLANLRQEYRLLQEGEFWPLALADDVYACRRFWSAQAIKSGQIKEDAADFE